MLPTRNVEAASEYPPKLAPELHATVPNLPPDAVSEISVYFCESWGNRTRIDYGSGMELNFLCWMCVLASSHRVPD